MADKTELRDEMAGARARESEALRRARRLQVTGAERGLLREAMQDLEDCHRNCNEIARALAKDR